MSICCDPKTDSTKCKGPCMPKEWWAAKDDSEMCKSEEHVIGRADIDPPTTIGEDFTEIEETEEE